MIGKSEALRRLTLQWKDVFHSNNLFSFHNKGGTVGRNNGRNNWLMRLGHHPFFKNACWNCYGVGRLCMF